MFRPQRVGRCGSARKHSRGAPNYRQRFKGLIVYHSPNGRQIRWLCHDIM